MSRNQADRYHADAAVTAFHEQAQPDLDEVLQRPEPVCPIPVEHIGPVQVHNLPARAGVTMTVTATTTGEQILGQDWTRKRAVLISTDSAFAVSTTRLINGATLARWPANVPMEITHCDAVTVATLTGTATVSLITEHWAQ